MAFPSQFTRIWITVLFILLLQLCSAQDILVPPYLQPGNVPSLNKEEKVIIWQTDDQPGLFKVEFTEGTSFNKSKVAKISSVNLNISEKPSKLYRATLRGLKFDRSYTYRVSLNDKVLAEHSFKTRTKKSQTRFAVLADVGAGTTEQAEIAYQVSLQDPQFVLVLGDMAYNNGRELEYRHRFFPYYLTSTASPENGAPLLKSIPFYMVLGNHDVYSYNLDEYPDGLAYFYYSDLPRNAPIPKKVIEPEGDIEKIKEFKKHTSPQYPGISNYSFENGNVLIINLDSNNYVNPLDPALIEWIRRELNESKAHWKIVSYHHAAFNASPTHYDYQIMRLISPVLEEMGVDLVLSAHEHNYQRTLPLKFKPAINEEGTQYIISEEGRVDGTFQLDTIFDGKTNTVANGIIYIITGAGGGALYDPELTDNQDLWQKGTPENWAPYTVRLISNTHSFTLIETNGKELFLRQIDAEGKTLDEIRISK